MIFFKSISNSKLSEIFDTIPSVEIALHRRQLRWLGHVARMDGSRIPLKLLTAMRADDDGQSGCQRRRGATLLGVFGDEGCYKKLVAKYLNVGARQKFFGGRRGDCFSWMEFAKDRSQWRAFVKRGVKK